MLIIQIKKLLKTRFLYIVLWTFFSLTSCKTIVLSKSTDRKILLQLPTSFLNKEIVAVQKIGISFRGKQQNFIVQLEITKEKLVLVALTEFGVRLFTILYDNKQLYFSPGSLPKAPIDPALILSDLQLIYWPKPSLDKILSKYDALLLQSIHNPYTRELIVSGKEIIKVLYSSNNLFKSNVYLHDSKNGYNLTIENLELNNL